MATDAIKQRYIDMMNNATSQAERESIAQAAANAALAGSKYGSVAGLRAATPSYAYNQGTAQANTGGARLAALNSAANTGGGTGGGSVISTGGSNMPTAPEMPDFTGQVNSMYDTQLTARMNALKMAQERAAGELRAQRQAVPGEYRTMKNQADTQNVISADRLRAAMAANGIRGGQNISTQGAIETTRSAALSKLSAQEQATLDEIDRRISNIYNAGDEMAINSEVEAARAAALLNAQQNAYNMQYGQYRDAVGDTRYTDETAYSRGRDVVGDTQYADETSYNRGIYADQTQYQRGRDVVADQRYDALQSYQQGRDKEADKRYYDEQAWARSADNPAVRTQILSNQINEIQLQYLPEQSRLQLEQLRKTIDQIGRQPAKDPVQAQIQQVELDTAREKLRQLQQGGGANAVDTLKASLGKLPVQEAYDNLVTYQQDIIADIGIDEYNKILRDYAYAAGA